jgi:hypothetical protein
MGEPGEAHVHPRTDGDTETLPCVKVALPITASVSFRAASAAPGVDEEWRSIATETAPRPQEVLQLAAVAVTASSPALLVDDSPTDIMTRLWWTPKVSQVVRPALWEPPVPIIPQLPLELLPQPPPPVERTVLRPARKATTDSRTIVAPLSLLLVALSVVPPVANAPASSAHTRTVSIAMREAVTTTPSVVCPPAPEVAPVVPAAAPVVAAAAPVRAATPVTVAVQRRPTFHAAPRRAPPSRSSGHLVREVPF